MSTFSGFVFPSLPVIFDPSRLTSAPAVPQPRRYTSGILHEAYVAQGRVANWDFDT